MLFDLTMALQSRETHNIALKYFSIPNVPIRLRALAKNNAVEFSIRMMKLTRLCTKLLQQVNEDFSGLFSFKNMENVALRDSFCTYQEN